LFRNCNHLLVRQPSTASCRSQLRPLAPTPSASCDPRRKPAHKPRNPTPRALAAALCHSVFFEIRRLFLDRDQLVRCQLLSHSLTAHSNRCTFRRKRRPAVISSGVDVLPQKHSLRLEGRRRHRTRVAHRAADACRRSLVDKGSALSPGWRD